MSMIDIKLKKVCDKIVLENIETFHFVPDC